MYILSIGIKLQNHALPGTRQSFHGIFLYKVAYHMALDQLDKIEMEIDLL